MLNIWGVMLFIRLSWVFGQAGAGKFLLSALRTVVLLNHNHLPPLPVPAQLALCAESHMCITKGSDFFPGTPCSGNGKLITSEVQSESPLLSEKCECRDRERVVCVQYMSVCWACSEQCAGSWGEGVCTQSDKLPQEQGHGVGICKRVTHQAVV